jgi:hypothetical protein
MIGKPNPYWKHEGLLRLSYKKFDKKLNMVKSKEDWRIGYRMALDNLNEYFKFSEYTIKKARKIGYDYYDAGNNKTLSRYVIGATVLYIILKQRNKDVSMRDVEKMTKISRISIIKCMNDIKDKMAI